MHTDSRAIRVHIEVNMDEYRKRKQERTKIYNETKAVKSILCTACNGSGWYDWGSPKCGCCGGTGKIKPIKHQQLI